MRIRATSPKNGSGDKSESGEGIPGAEMRSQILFQMDHCPAMFDNCHRYQGMTGPLKMAKQNSTKYRAVVEVTKLLLIPCHLLALCPKLLLSSNPFHDSWWWIYAAFFASTCHQTRCIYANCELSVREMYRWRLAANESLAQSTPWDRVLQTCNEPTSRRRLRSSVCRTMILRCWWLIRFTAEFISFMFL